MRTTGCWRRRLVVLAIATSWLTGCETVSFEKGGVAACPPVVEYSREFQSLAVEELALLPQGLAIAEMLSDYAVMRDQARACNGVSPLITRRQERVARPPAIPANRPPASVR